MAEAVLAGKSAFVVGSTGESGKVLLHHLLSNNVFSKLVSIARRKVEYTDEIYTKLEQCVVDFDKLETDHADAFQGFDVGFCCLGTTKGKAGADGFVKVDHDYVVATAKLAKAGGCKHFILMSSMGANANSSILLYKTKGRAEESCKEIGFEQLTIVRPGMLMVDREERRPAEAVARFFMKPLTYICPTLMTTPLDVLIPAMTKCATEPTGNKVETLENAEIFKLAGKK